MTESKFIILLLMASAFTVLRNLSLPWGHGTILYLVFQNTCGFCLSQLGHNPATSDVCVQC